MIARDLEIIARLKAEPKAVARPEVACQTKGRIRGDRPGAMDDLVDPARRHTDVLGEPVLRNAQRLEDVEGEDFSRRCPPLRSSTRFLARAGRIVLRGHPLHAATAGVKY